MCPRLASRIVGRRGLTGGRGYAPAYKGAHPSLLTRHAIFTEILELFLDFWIWISEMNPRADFTEIFHSRQQAVAGDLTGAT